MHIKKILKELNQNILLQEYENFSPDEKINLQRQLLSFDLLDLKKQMSSFLEHKSSQAFLSKIDRYEKSDLAFEPLLQCHYLSEKYIPEGKKSLERGEIGIIVLSGGMASRLQWGHPKGMFPITLVKKKTIFQLICEKILAAQKKYKSRFFISFMTSEKNHLETIDFFRENQYFGLDPFQIDFFIQGELPFLDDEGNFVRRKDKIITGPDGNGDLFERLKKTPLFEKMKEAKVKYLSVIPIDNPLADPLDEVFIGFHVNKKSSVSFIAIEKENNNNEIMGVIAKSDNKIKIIEYIHLSENQKKEYRYLNSALFCFSLDFISKNNFSLPFHHVKKRIDSEDQKFWKSEKFIFDVLDYCFLKGEVNSWSANVICFPKNKCYAPLKNKEGKDSVNDVQAALYQKDIEIFFNITGKKPENKIFELAPDFHYPTNKLLDDWKGRDLPDSSYVEP